MATTIMVRPTTAGGGQQRPTTSNGDREESKSVVFGNDIAWNELGLDDDDDSDADDDGPLLHNPVKPVMSMAASNTALLSASASLASSSSSSSSMAPVPAHATLAPAAAATSPSSSSLSSSPSSMANDKTRVVPPSPPLIRVTTAFHDHINGVPSLSSVTAADSSRSTNGISPAIALPLASNRHALPISTSFSASVNIGNGLGAATPGGSHREHEHKYDTDHDHDDEPSVSTSVRTPHNNAHDWAEREAALVRAALVSMSTGQPQPYAYPHYPAASTPPRGMSRNGLRSSRIGGGLPSSLANRTMNNNNTHSNTSNTTNGGHVPIRLGAARGGLRMMRSHEYDDMTPTPTESKNSSEISQLSSVDDSHNMMATTDSGRIGTRRPRPAPVIATIDTDAKRSSDRKVAHDNDDRDDLLDDDSKDEKKSPRRWQYIPSSSPSAILGDQPYYPLGVINMPTGATEQHRRVRDLDSDSSSDDEDDLGLPNSSPGHGGVDSLNYLDMANLINWQQRQQQQQPSGKLPHQHRHHHDRDLGLELGLMERCNRCHQLIGVGTAAIHQCISNHSNNNNISMGPNPISFQMGAPTFGRRPSRVTYPGGEASSSSSSAASSSSSAPSTTTTITVVTPAGRLPSFHRDRGADVVRPSGNAMVAGGVPHNNVISSLPIRQRRVASPPRNRAALWHYPADLAQLGGNGNNGGAPAPGAIPTIPMVGRPGGGARLWADDIDVIDERARAAVNVPIGGHVIKTCILCLQDRPSYDMVALQSCHHESCKVCFGAYLDSMLKDRSKYPFVCFTPDCGGKLTYYDVSRTLTSAQLTIFDHFSIVSAYDPKDLVECPWPACGYLMVRDTADTNAMKRCVGCHRAFCNSCHIPWHQGQTCAQYIAANQHRQAATREEKIAEAALHALARAQHWSACPRCHQLVEKNGGCNHMRHYRKEGCTLAAPLLPGSADPCTHFCACCGVQLNDTNHRHDLRGRLHFPRGLFEPCVDAQQTPMFTRRGDGEPTPGAPAGNNGNVAVGARRRRCIIM